MQNTFISGMEYNAMQTLSPLALAKDHCPVHYTGLIFVESIPDENGVVEHKFLYDGEERIFDDDFVNNGRSFDNSVIIVERKVN